MSVHVTIHDGPLPPADDWFCDGAGALIAFEGVVRPSEDEREITSLSYEAYEPMASRMLHTLAEQAIERFGVLLVIVEHSRGEVPAGACSFRLRVASRHRKEGLAAMDWFIDAMKRDVPIWKSPVFAPASTGAAP